MTRRRVCATPEPGQSVEERVDQLAADGHITVHDADEVHNFAAFLRCTVGLPKDKSTWTDEHRKAFSAAYQHHYPEDYARAIAERDARAAEA